jgi:hypothetical protein
MIGAGLILGAMLCRAAPAPPADVDQALRARITAFYQMHVDGRFRQADAYVAEDTKDFYYIANKPKYMSFQIANIDYSEDFTRAKATILCEQVLMIPGFMDKPMKVPTPSLWKLEAGKWCWWVDQNAFRQTPFGTMKPGTGTAAAPLPQAPPGPAEMGFVLQGVKLEKQEVVLKSGEDSSAQVAIANTLSGVVNLSVSGAVPGVDATLDRTALKAGEKATLTLHSKGGAARSGTLVIEVAQTARQLPLKVVVK